MVGLQQSLQIQLVQVQPISIHNSLYYQITYQRLDELAERADAPYHEMRINPEAFYSDPKPGDKVAVNLLMGNIMGAQRLEN